MKQSQFEFAILNIDKPSGPTSFDVSDYVRKKLGLRKTSHFGTLDPKVTGVLPIALNRACKLTGFFIGHDKTYVGIMRIHEERDMIEIQKIIDKKFIGLIKQTPPVKSRVKRQEREREIKSFKLLEQEGSVGKDILFECEVQGGTYIRKLIDDLGKEIGGAHMLELRRTRAGIFDEEDKEFINLYDVDRIAESIDSGDKKIDNKKGERSLEVEDFVNNKENSRVDGVGRVKRDFGGKDNIEKISKLSEKEIKKYLIPAEEALKKIFPSVNVKTEAMKHLLTGKRFRYEDILTKKKFDKGDKVIAFAGEKFIGVYTVTNEKETFARPDFVLQPVRG